MLLKADKLWVRFRWCLVDSRQSNFQIAHRYWLWLFHFSPPFYLTSFSEDEQPDWSPTVAVLIRIPDPPHQSFLLQRSAPLPDVHLSWSGSTRRVNTGHSSCDWPTRSLHLLLCISIFYSSDESREIDERWVHQHEHWCHWNVTNAARKTWPPHSWVHSVSQTHQRCARHKPGVMFPMWKTPVRLQRQP